MPVYTEDRVRGAIERACALLRRNDLALFEREVNERSVTHKLAEYLQGEFPEWHVDCEYNRDGYDPKRLNFHVETVLSDNANAKTVYPDVIVHVRGTSQNLLVIEAKRGGNDDTFDREKLRAFQEQLGYRFAVMLIFQPDGATNVEFVPLPGSVSENSP